jgi:excisionase family DNA binding protein
MKTLLSTRDVADLMKVTETTIKRWSADGLLPCVKTPGGHRRYRMPDVLRFAEDRHYPLSGIALPASAGIDPQALEFSVYKRDFRAVTRLLVDQAPKGERGAVLEVLTYLAKHQVPIATIGDEVIRPALAEIGRLWNEGRIEISEEHAASQALLEAVIRLSPDLPRRTDNGLSAVCACAEGNHHEIGLRIICYALESEGWSVHYLGPNTPFETLRSYVATARPRLLCLSLGSGQHATVLEELRALSAMTRSTQTVFLIGGVSATAYAAADLGCDANPSSATEAIAFIRDRFRRKPGPKKVLHDATSKGGAS